MANYSIECTMIYNGTMNVEANSKDEALEKAQELLCNTYGDDFPDNGNFGKAFFTFGEATADYAIECSTNDNNHYNTKDDIINSIINEGYTKEQAYLIFDETNVSILVGEEKTSSDILAIQSYCEEWYNDQKTMERCNLI